MMMEFIFSDKSIILAVIATNIFDTAAVPCYTCASEIIRGDI
jgi:hypothetical protein